MLNGAKKVFKLSLLRYFAHTCRRLLLLALITLLQSAHAQAQAAQPVAPSDSSTLSQKPPQPVMLDGKTQHVDLVHHAEYWIDPSPDTSITALQARASAGFELFKPSRATDAHAVHGKVLWFRFETKASDVRSRWILELGSPLIDDVRLYWQATHGQWLSLRAGDAVPRKEWPLPGRLPSFALDSSTPEPMQYYLRVENARVPVSLPMRIYRDTAYFQAQQLDQLFLGALAGLVILMFVTAVVFALGRREEAFAACAAYLLVLGLFNLTSTGLMPVYVWNESPLIADRMNYILAAITAALGPWLVRLIMQPLVRVKTVNFVLAIHAMILLACAAAEMWYPTKMSYNVLNAGVLLSVVWVYVLVAMAWQRGDVITRWVALSFAPVALSALPMILRNLGAIPNSWLTQWAVPIATAIELPLLMYALLARSNLRREGLARAAGLPSQDALTGLPNMRIFLQYMHGSTTRAYRFGHRYGLIHIQLVNYDWFVKEHGREMADRALILTSSRLQSQVRDVDTVCRLDESHFVVLVEGACHARQLAKLAARLSASGHAPTEILPVGASLRLSICCALMPTEESHETGDDAHAQPGWLIAAAEALPPEQRKLVRSIGF